MANDYSKEKDLNRRYWDALVAVNADTEGYDGYNIKAFLQGERDLHLIELSELDDVAGLSLLHLQCHFGMDTLMLARRGARVVAHFLKPGGWFYLAEAHPVMNTI